MSSAAQASLGEDFKALRAAHGLTQIELARALGYKDKSTVSRIERGATPGSREIQRKFRRVQRRLQAEAASAGAEPPPDEPGQPEPGAPTGAGDEGGAGIGRDLPPLAEPAGAPPEEEEESLLTLSGRSVSVRSLGHFQKIELSLLTFLVGKEIVYTTPSSGGKAKEASVHQAGVADFLPSPADAAVLRELAPEIAHAWADWAKTNSRVNALLSFLIIEGGFKGVAAVMGKLLFLIAQNHGFDPVGMLTGAPPIVEGVTAAGYGSNHDGHPPHPGDESANFEQPPYTFIEPAAGTGLFEGTPYGFSNADGIEG